MIQRPYNCFIKLFKSSFCVYLFGLGILVFSENKDFLFLRNYILTLVQTEKPLDNQISKGFF